MPREGSLEAPTRHAIDWQSDAYCDAPALNAELARVFDICHGCRRCFSLCNAFPTLFDLVDESATGELHSVPVADYAKVVEHCYLCDMCYMTKCPYVPPHEWNVDFPHLMLRAKTKQFRDGKTKLRDRLLSSTDAVGAIAGIPVIAEIVNAVNGSKLGRGLLDAVAGIDRAAPVPKYHSKTARKRLAERVGRRDAQATATDGTAGRVVVFTTCYGNRNQPKLVADLVAVLEHNEIPVTLLASERCCGMPKLELGDLESVRALKERNIEALHELVAAGWDVTAPIPSCVLMFKQELPLLFPDDPKVRAVAEAFFDPFEYLLLRHRAGRLKVDFKQELGKISYQVPCHLRVQNLGLKTRAVLELVPNTSVAPIERCSGHDGTYAVKKEYHEIAAKIARPVARQADGAAAQYFTSDCPMAAEQVAHVSESVQATHPIELLRRAYGI
ncbi:MAG TPA: heterodisulfide reductase-related iron-sulfur binding cluster [Gammaproteobacteria bacterium]